MEKSSIDFWLVRFAF